VTTDRGSCVRAIDRTLVVVVGVVAMTAVERADSAPKADNQAPSASVVRSDESWNAVFERQDGWTGADVAGTVLLGDGRVVWVFGDTWIGSVRDGKRVPGSRMVNNSIAVHAIDRAAPWRAPDPKAVRFYWGRADSEGRPTAWAIPSAQNGEWLWPTGGGLAVRGPAGSLRLFVFFFRVARKPQGTGVWNFAIVGTALGVVENAAEPADRWHVRVLAVPHCVLPRGLAAQVPVGAPAEPDLTWGMACVDAGSGRQSAGDAWVYGVRRGVAGDRALVLARAPAVAIDRFDAWRFYAGPDAWSPRPAAAAPLAHGMVSEFSVERLENHGRAVWTLVQSEPFLGKRILLRTAAQVAGPWSVAKPVASVPEVERNRSYFTYAAKGHAGISRPGELLVSYLVNSNQFADLTSDLQIYHPKFVRVALPFPN
jgi:hypothetical protein